MLSVVGCLSDESLENAINKAYESVSKIRFDGMIFRSDIGKQLLKKIANYDENFSDRRDRLHRLPYGRWRLIKAGYEVIIIDNLSNSKEFIDRIEMITGTRPVFVNADLRDKNGLNEFFKTTKGIDAVIHFAAFKAVANRVKDPLLYYDNNISA